MTKRPPVGTGVIVKKDNKILLGKRNEGWGAGTWSLPGGHLEMYETVAECGARETKEETNIDITNIKPGPFVENIHPEDNKHTITLILFADYKSGEPKVMEPHKFDKWEWFAWDKLPIPLYLPTKNFVDLKVNPLQNGFR